jgi:hypothetical protein
LSERETLNSGKVYAKALLTRFQISLAVFRTGSVRVFDKSMIEPIFWFADQES